MPYFLYVHILAYQWNLVSWSFIYKYMTYTLFLALSPLDMSAVSYLLQFNLEKQ